MRLDKLLANAGYGTRKEVKKWLSQGLVTVNSQIIKGGGVHVDPTKDDIRIQGEHVVYKEFIYLMLNKPAGVITATHDSRDKTVLDLLDHRLPHYADLFPVGRLDKDTEGLLLITNDGTLAHQLLSPKKHVPKTYYAHIEGQVSEEDKRVFAEGVYLDDGYKTLPAQLDILKSTPVSNIHLTIYEGKFHQVKRMFLSRGKKVSYLKRIQMGGLVLDPKLELGKYRELRKEEVEQLRGEGGA